MDMLLEKEELKWSKSDLSDLEYVIMSLYWLMKQEFSHLLFHEMDKLKMGQYFTSGSEVGLLVDQSQVCQRRHWFANENWRLFR